MGSRETASTSVSPYSVQTTENWSISLGRTEENQNLITYCYIPLQCQFVSHDLADVHSQGMDGDVPVIKMTPFYVNELGKETSSTLEVRPCGHGCGRCTTGHN